jgi:hypothetical protein
MEYKAGIGMQVLYEVNLLMDYDDRVSVLGFNGLSKMVVVEAPDSIGSSLPIGDPFLRHRSPRLLPAAIGDLLLALGKYRATLEDKSPLLQETEIETVKQVEGAYRLALEQVAQDGEMRSLVELFIWAIRELSSLNMPAPKEEGK